MTEQIISFVSDASPDLRIFCEHQPASGMQFLCVRTAQGKPRAYSYTAGEPGNC
jgi:hypothetical protein